MLPFDEVFDRYLSGLASPEIRSWLFAAAGIWIALALSLVLGWPRRGRAWLVAAVLAPVALLGLARAWSLAWVADDAFISFRFADNLVHGHGLVFNPGERVEGYTNFLWTMIAAGAIALGQSPVEATLVLSMAAFTGVLVLVTRLVWLLAPPASPVTLSLAAAALAGNYVMGSFATSGLETMAAASMVLLSIERATVGKPLAAGLAGICAALLHPDHLIFYGALGAVLLLEQRRWRLVALYALPFVALYVPYFLWRLDYYGDVYPNTYYAKSGHLRYFSQGRVYLLVNTFAAGAAAALPFAVAGLLGHLKTILARVAWLSVPVYLTWIAKIGGDFMLGRLLVPVLPIALVLAELAVRRWLASGWLARGIGLAGSAAILLAGVPARVIEPAEKIWQLADERTFYQLESLRPLRVDSMYFEHGLLFRRVFRERGLSPRYATGCVGMVGYLSRLPILDTLGLNDPIIARRPVGKRSRPGHERPPTGGDVIPRAPDFSDEQHYPAPYDAHNSINIAGSGFHLMAFRTQLLDALAADRSVRFEDARQLLDAWEPTAARRAPDELACDAWFHSTYYFAHNDDPSRRTAFLAKIARADRTLDGAESLLLDDSSWIEVAREDFESSRDEWLVHGDAFREFPQRTQVPKQGTVGNRAGAYANSFDRHALDDATGRAVRRLPLLGDAITLRVGGGRDREALRVALTVDGQIFEATGCNSDVLGRRVWNVSAHRGKLATLELIDARGGGWGHIVVDEVMQWRRR